MKDTNDNPEYMFDSWVKEAMKEFGRYEWRQVPPNVLSLVLFGMTIHRLNKRIDRIVKPAWTVAVAVGCSALWFIISSIFGF